MIQLFVFLHVLSAIMMGIYLMMPFLSMRIQVLTGHAQFGFVSVLFALNRTGQMALIIALLSGGYLVSKSPHSLAWLIATIVIFLALGAITGVLGGAMRKSLSEPSGSKIQEHLGKIKSMSVISGILFFLMVGIMMFQF
ncbi:hypothetical protein [Paenibacillus agricola]|uniref:DUF2269 family protein n=1 Tax=Paenibacillus agricola TaxID=2716264 RepID=A0ABX0J8N8_9BACL|nr:hypothetical protein [Paenibacillus agricola]NHN31549.1 hypothetical protein [Paenibacillus agricola]